MLVGTSVEVLWPLVHVEVIDVFHLEFQSYHSGKIDKA
jgi:hypothetical protein